MEIKILQLTQGAANAKGLTVIIDVFRAFTTECFIMHQGAKTILPVGKVEEAYAIKKQNPQFLLLGERDEIMLPGFDFGNSPANIENLDFTGKTIVHTTSAGTQGIAAAKQADEIITGSLVNAPAIAQYIINRNPEQVSLVCMGKAALHPTPEDTCCAEYIQSILLNQHYPLQKNIRELRQSEGMRFFNPHNQEQCPEADFTLSTDVGRFHFVLRLEPPDENCPYHHIRRISV